MVFISSRELVSSKYWDDRQRGLKHQEFPQPCCHESSICLKSVSSSLDKSHDMIRENYPLYEDPTKTPLHERHLVMQKYSKETESSIFSKQIAEKNSSLGVPDTIAFCCVLGFSLYQLVSTEFHFHTKLTVS